MDTRSQDAISTRFKLLSEKQSNRSAAGDEPELHIHAASDGNEKDSLALAAIAHFFSITRFIRLQESWLLAKHEYVSEINFSSKFINEFSSIETAKVRQGPWFCLNLRII